MIKNIKIKNILDIIKVSKLIQLSKCIHLKKSNENIYLSFLYLSKVQWV